MAMFDGEPLVTIDGPNGPMQVPASVAAQLVLGSQRQNISAGEYGGLSGLAGQMPINNQTPPAPPPTMKPFGQPLPPSAPQSPITNPFPNAGPKNIGPGSPQAEETAGPTPASTDIPSPVTQQLSKMAAPGIDLPGQTPDAVSGPPGTGPTFVSPPIGPQPLTTERLRKEGLAGPLNQANVATDEQAVAARQKAAQESIGLTSQAAAYADKKVADEEAMKQWVKEQQAEAAYKQQIGARIAKANDKIINTKIDRESDHPVMNMIGIILSGIGTAMLKQSNNPAIDALYKALDRKVAAQMADVEKARGDVSLMRDSLVDHSKIFSDKTALRDALLAANLTRTENTIKQIAAETGSDTAKTNADMLIGKLHEEAAMRQQSAAERQATIDIQREKTQQEERASVRTTGLGYSQLAEHKRQFNAQLDWDKTKEEATKTLALMQLDAKEREDKSKAFAKAKDDNNEKAIGNAITEGYLLNHEGVQQVTAAKQLEDKAAQVEAAGNKAAADTMRAKAASIRADAQSFNTIKAPSGELKGKITDQYTGAMEVTRLSREIQSLYDTQGGPTWLKSDAGKAAIQSKMTELLMNKKNIDQLGVLSKVDINQLQQEMGSDPTKWDTAKVASVLTDGLVGEDPANFKSRLNSMTNGAQDKILTQIKTLGGHADLTKEDLFGKNDGPVPGTVREMSQAVLKEDTPREAADNARGGSVRNNVIDLPGNVGKSAKSVLGGDYVSKEDQRVLNTEGTASPKYGYGGLTTQQGDTVAKIIDVYKNANDPADREAAKRNLLELASVKGRDELGHGVMQALRADAPDVYRAALPLATEDVRKQMQYEDKGAGFKAPSIEIARKHLGLGDQFATEDSAKLAGMAAHGQVDAYNELAARAAAGDAKAAAYYKGARDYIERRGAQEPQSTAITNPYQSMR